MRTTTLLAALALGTALTGQAFASHWNKEATATPVIVADGCSNCAVQQPDEPPIPQTPEDGCNSCATPTPPAQKLADPCSTCVVDQPSDAIPSEPKDGCTSCATTRPPAQKLADPCSNCAVDQPTIPDPFAPKPTTQDPLVKLADGGSCSGC